LAFFFVIEFGSSVFTTGLSVAVEIADAAG
jgi:hypothetical protein